MSSNTDDNLERFAGSLHLQLPGAYPPNLATVTAITTVVGLGQLKMLWLCEYGILPLYTPLSGSWLNMAESIQRILKRRALDGQHPETPQQIMDRFETAAKVWNQHPTPFAWGANERYDGNEGKQDDKAIG